MKCVHTLPAVRPQRGPVIGAAPPEAWPPSGPGPAWNPDARLVAINTLLWSAWGDAYRCMSPKL